jgi:3-oxoacyl-[acyl-carrier-protein] synthase I
MSVYLNSVGLNCALGSDLDEIRAHLFEGSAPGMISTDAYSPGRCLTLGVAPDPLPSLAGYPQQWQSRNNQLLAAAFSRIENDFRAIARGVPQGRIAVVMGTSTSGIGETESAMQHRLIQGVWPDHYRLAQHELGMTSAFLATLAGSQGPCYTISTACSSSARALASAARILRSGVADIVLAGGVDSLCRFTVAGFCRFP